MKTFLRLRLFPSQLFQSLQLTRKTQSPLMKSLAVAVSSKILPCPLGMQVITKLRKLSLAKTLSVPERNFASALESARESSISSTVGTNLSQNVSSTGVTSGTNVSPPPSSSTRLNSNNFKNRTSELKRTCEDRGFQIYMKGLSQLKQGKRSDAKKTLIRASKMRGNLYDVHFRLSLLEYQDGNIEKAI